MNQLVYIIPITVILIIFIISFGITRKKAAQYGETYAAESEKAAKIVVEEAARNDRIYEKLRVNQISSHSLGAVQSVIRGRIRFALFGIMLIGIALLGLYIIYLTDLDFFFPREPLYILAATIILVGAIGWGLQMLYFTTCKIRLRRHGLEICSIFGAKSYEYKDIDIHLYQSIEHKDKGSGYRPVLMKAGDFNFVWICQITIKSQYKLIEIKSSRYAWLRQKMTDLTQSLAWVD